MENTLTPPTPPAPPAPAPPPEPAADTELPPERAKLFGVLEWGAPLLGTASLCDAALNAFTGGDSPPHEGLLTAYILTLYGYSAAREWQKWTRPGEDDAPRNGHLFVFGWIALAITAWTLESIGWTRPVVAWPENLNAALYHVLGCYVGTRFFSGLRKSGWRRGFYPVHAAAFRAASRAPAAAAPAPKPERPGPDLPPLPDAREILELREENYRFFQDAARRLGKFRRVDLAQATNYNRTTTSEYMLRMRRDKLIERVPPGNGYYRWIGPGAAGKSAREGLGGA
ncbi:MAG: hypothetical protein HY059_23050 [Proteobacteria bacterium]|nr:hypothetical protein [Pseudomonadota bacterium]